MRHPRELWVLTAAVICERFAFWGITDLLILYVVDYYRFDVVQATRLYGLFAGFAAFMPLVGGFIADRWNIPAALLLGAILNVSGCFLLTAGTERLLYPALFTLAFGIGLFAPSILTLLGYSYRNHPHLRDAGFSIYYASINVGVLLALVILGYLVQYSTWTAVFFVAGMIQLIGLIPIIYYLIKHKETYQDLQMAQGNGTPNLHPFTKEEKKRLTVIFILSLFAFVFWIAYSQAWSAMPLYIKGTIDRTIEGWTVPIGWIMASESLSLILLAPLLACLYPFLQKRRHDPSPPFKMAIGMAFISLSFVLMTFASANIPSTALIVPICFYILTAIGEMLLAPIGLSRITQLAPRGLTALLVGFWYVCSGCASFIGGNLAGFMDRMGGLNHYFAIFIFLTLIPSLILACFARKLNRFTA